MLNAVKHLVVSLCYVPVMLNAVEHLVVSLCYVPVMLNAVEHLVASPRDETLRCTQRDKGREVRSNGSPTIRVHSAPNTRRTDHRPPTTDH
jgi:hypothetical protein